MRAFSHFGNQYSSWREIYSQDLSSIASLDFSQPIGAAPLVLYGRQFPAKKSASNAFGLIRAYVATCYMLDGQLHF